MTVNAFACSSKNDRLNFAVDIVSAYVSKNVLPSKDLPGLVISVHDALAGLGRLSAVPTVKDADFVKPTPAQIRKSITPDALTSFIDGNSYRTLKRHLRAHGLDPHTYRERYGLPADYPMIAPSYSEQRSALAKGFGLGRPGRRAEKQAA